MVAIKLFEPFNGRQERRGDNYLLVIRRFLKGKVHLTHHIWTAVMTYYVIKWTKLIRVEIEGDFQEFRLLRQHAVKGIDCYV